MTTDDLERQALDHEIRANVLRRATKSVRMMTATELRQLLGPSAHISLSFVYADVWAYIHAPDYADDDRLIAGKGRDIPSAIAEAILWMATEHSGKAVQLRNQADDLREATRMTGGDMMPTEEG